MGVTGEAFEKQLQLKPGACPTILYHLVSLDEKIVGKLVSTG